MQPPTAAEAAHAAALDDAMPRTTGAARAAGPLLLPLPLLLSCLLIPRSAAASEPPAHVGRIVGPGTTFAPDAGPVVGILTARKDMDCTGTLIANDGKPSAAAPRTPRAATPTPPSLRDAVD